MEIQPGKYNTMRVVKQLDFGIYLDGGEMGEILMPTKWVPQGTLPEDMLEVFIYFDSSDRPIATTIKPRAQVGEFAWLKVKVVDRIGAFLDWGLDKDLLVPFKEQNAKMEEGRSYLVYLYVDPRSKRIAASARLEKFLDVEPATYSQGQEVELLIWTRTEMGYKAIINQKHQGLLYSNQLFQNIKPGQTVKGYVLQVRPDGKIDLGLQPTGYENKMDDMVQRILDALHEQDGFLPITDKTDAEEVYKALKMSKKNFKKAVGALYKQRRILLNNAGISLIEKE